MQSTDQLAELSEADIQKQLAAGSVSGPKSFRGRPLASYSSGLRDLILKIVSPQDTLRFHDVTMLHILAEAHGATKEDRVAKRVALIRASDDVDAFRARVSVEILDELTPAEIDEARRLVNEIITPGQQAQVVVQVPAGAKKKTWQKEAEPDDSALLVWPLAAATGWDPEFIRWELALVDVFRYRHAQLWLDGHRCRRISRQGPGSAATRRARFDTLAARYACRN